MMRELTDELLELVGAYEHLAGRDPADSGVVAELRRRVLALTPKFRKYGERRDALLAACEAALDEITVLVPGRVADPILRKLEDAVAGAKEPL